MVKGLIITFTGAVFLNIRSLFRNRQHFVDKFNDILGLKLGWHELNFSGSLKDGKEFNFSVKLLAILHHLELKGINNSSVNVLNEFAVEQDINYARQRGIEKEKKKTEHLLPEAIEVESNVFCKVNLSPGNGTDGPKDKAVHIRIYSNVVKIPELVSLVKQWERDYEEYNMFEKGLRYFVFNPPNYRDQVGYPRKYTEFSFESGKTFENLFFPEKDKLVKKIQFFLDNESWYTKHGIPYMFGLLFHGEPGCGKTSTIKAIANMTQRHIISVPLKNVQSISDLYEVMYGEKVNKVSIPMNKRLYVLEDIDCAGLEDLVKKRANEPQLPPNNPDSDDECHPHKVDKKARL